MIQVTPSRCRPAGAAADRGVWFDEMVDPHPPRGVPTAWFECLQAWAAAFAAGGTGHLRVASVWRNGIPAAVLPVVTRRRHGLVWRTELPANPWLVCGGLSVNEPRADESVFDELADRILQIPGHYLDFQLVPAAAAWDALAAAFVRRGCRVDRRVEFQTGIITWSDRPGACLDHCSGNHRKKMRAAWKRLNGYGEVRLERDRGFASADCRDALLSEVIDMEQRSWKGQRGSAIANHPSVEVLFRRVAATLDERGLLEIHRLLVDGRPVAFDLGCRAGTTWYSHKIGFDREFARFSPGQLLLYAQLQQWSVDGEVNRIDTMGAISAATSKWTTTTEPRYRYRISRPGQLDRWAMQAFCRTRDLLKCSLHQ